MGKIEMNDLISVIVPIYNVEKYLSKCVESILKQTYTNLEIILVDDGSPDNCGNMCETYKKSDNRIVVIHKKNGGLSSARNAGLKIANGEFIVFIDSDDWIDRHYIEQLYIDIVEQNADVAVPAFCISFENGKSALDSRIKEVTCFTKEKALEVFLFNGYLTPCVASKMWKKSLWKNIKCPDGKLFEDQYTTYRLLMLANKAVFDPRVNYYYFKRIGSIGHSPFSERTYDLLVGIEEEYNEITKAYPQTLDSLKTARTVWELVFVNMMILSAYNDKHTVQSIRKRSRKAYSCIIKCAYLPTIRKWEISLFCFSFTLYKCFYKVYRSLKVLHEGL